MKDTEKIYPYMIMDLRDLDGEIWKDVKDFEGCYQVSNLGRVKSLERKVRSKLNSYRTEKQKILKQALLPNGYLRVRLRNAFQGIDKMCSVHRLVAKTFLTEYSEDLTVNHINEIKVDNRVENLNMMTQKEQNLWGTRIGRVSKANINNPKQSKQVGQYSLDGTLISIYPSTRECDRQGFNQGAVGKCCNNKFNKEGNNIYKGFQWRFI